MQTAATVPTCARSPHSCPVRWPLSATAPVGWAVDPSGNLDYLASYSNYGQSAISFARPGGDTPSARQTRTASSAGITRPCWVFDLVFAPAVCRSTGWDRQQLLVDCRHQHGRTARLRRGRADHRQAWRRDGAVGSRDDPARVRPTTWASRVTTTSTAVAASTRRKRRAVLIVNIASSLQPDGRLRGGRLLFAVPEWRAMSRAMTT